MRCVARDLSHHMDVERGCVEKSKIINIFSMECVKAVSSETPCCQSNKNSRFILCGYIVMAITLTVSMVAGAVWGLDRGEDWDASTRMITARELLSFDGKDGRPAYFSYRGKVYDVTQSPFLEGWKASRWHYCGSNADHRANGARAAWRGSSGCLQSRRSTRGFGCFVAEWNG